MRTFSGLWRHPDFLKLWAGQTVSLFGSQITLLALPLTAVITLQASTLDMGWLRFATTLPALLFGLIIGIWIDRLRRRRMLIFADLGRALLLGSIPLAAFLHLLSMPMLYAVSFLTGFLTLLFDVSAMSYLPSLIERKDLIEGNSKLEVSRSGALIAGPSVAGLLVQLISAPFAIVVDALSFLVSVLSLVWIHRPEPRPVSEQQPAPFWSELRVGLHFIWRQPVLRVIVASLAVFNFFSSALSSLYVIYVVRALGVTPASLGLIYGIGSIGFLLGAGLVKPITERIGIGQAILWGAFLCDGGYLLILLAHGSSLLVICLLIAAQLVTSFGGPVTAIAQGSYRQAITPTQLQGRVNGANRFFASCLSPAGALIGGALGIALGLQWAMIVVIIGLQMGAFIFLLSPIRKVHDVPAPSHSVS